MPSTATVSRSRAAKRHNRADRDGDLLMGTSKNRTRVGKGPSAHTNKGKKDGILSSNAQRAILRQAGKGDVSMKDNTRRPGGLVEFKITGWDKSKASDNEDRGVSALMRWLEKKASLRLGSKKREVKIKKSRVDGTDLFISVPEQDAQGIQRINGFAWASTKLHIQRVGESNSRQNSKTEETKAMFRGVLERRYNPELKLLDLSALGQDEELRAQSMFDNKSTASKCFPAMMVVLEKSFDTRDELNAAVESVSLAHNELQNLSAVTTLAQTLPKLKNLDLSNNKFEKLSGLATWRKRFNQLQHLIISNNPLEQNEPNYATELVSWYPHLRNLNNTQVRTEEDVASGNKTTPLPFPIRGPNFQDQDGIAETFIRNYFAGMDGDRQALVAFYYDDHSNLAFALDSQAIQPPEGTGKHQKHEWQQYIGTSRNLKKITHLPTRVDRHLSSLPAILKAYQTMPLTKHPDLTTEANKWMIEVHTQPNVPDPTGQSALGVDGFNINIHCEFEEVDATTRQPTKKRSADHVIIIGPNTSGGVRIQSHEITIRSHSGFHSFEPQDVGDWHGIINAASPPPDAVPQFPPGITIEMAEQMVIELAKQTGMNLQYSKDCLEQVAWDFPKALEAFNNVKANIPAEAFIQPAA